MCDFVFGQKPVEKKNILSNSWAIELNGGSP